MTKSHSDKFVSSVQDFAFSQEGSTMILRCLGYGLLVLALFDVVEMLVPPNFMNPAWEFQTIGALVERVPVPLIGLAFVFYGEMNSRKRWEFPVLKVLSWLALVMGVVYILSIPLGVINAARLQRQSSTQINILSKQQINRAEQVKKQIDLATPEQIDNLLKRQGRSLELEPEKLKQRLLGEVSQAKQKIKSQAKATESSRGLNLLKKAVKWNLGAVVAGILCINIWKGTDWARMN
ncbi:HpsJ family protein [Mastigocoleus sp. MO_188.B34]|uniref:HpsJ-like protein, cyanoexosortase A-associated n=1 Tax=Mastigocoleus sp. MO_188.B34 TaxID=3036635 RepID=UPI0026287793|nr:HpsJ family protein [Mastigocoleus sp. MO_188.B34]MDJ0696864.1 HpsJ family protein [Mastigocoleus sp. MO_188.B34]